MTIVLGKPTGGSGGGGVSSFTGLTDTPTDYTGQGSKTVRVNSAENALEFVTPTDANDAVKVSSNDTTAGFLNGKLVAGTNITLTENTDGGDETLTITASGGSGDMNKAVYDTNNDGIVDEAAVITGQGALATLDEVTNAQIANGTIGTSNLSTAVTNSLALADSSVQPADIANFETTTQLNTRDTANRNRANHTGTQTLSTISDAGTAAGLNVPSTGDASAGEVVKGDDSRLTDSRTPTSHTHTASDITDFDTEVSNNADVAANTSSRHDAVTVLDTSEIDLSLTGQQLSASIVAGSIDETKLDASVNASLDLANSALQSGDIGTSVQAHSAVLDATTASFTTADETKLDGIESGADVTDTVNVTAAGALMDSEVTNLAQVKAFDSSDYATAAQGTKADSALQSADIGTSVQAYDTDLQAIAGLTPSNGDVLYYSSGWRRLARGTNDQVLTLSSGLPSWADAGGGGAGFQVLWTSAPTAGTANVSYQYTHNLGITEADVLDGKYTIFLAVEDAANNRVFSYFGEGNTLYIHDWDTNTTTSTSVVFWQPNTVVFESQRTGNYILSVIKLY